MDQKHLPPVFYSIVGLAICFAWLLLIIQLWCVQNICPSVNTYLLSFSKNALYWKPFSLAFFALGIYLTHRLGERPKAILYRNNLLFIAMGFILLAIVSVAIIFESVIVERPFFWELKHSPVANGLIPFMYGLIIILIGVWAEKDKWLYEYHFQFKELKAVFKYSILLYIAWFLLKYFKAYSYITEGIVGKIVYMIDALTINLLLAFIYLFLLIAMENYRFGKRILKLLNYLGKYWYINAVVIAAAYMAYNILS